jgi:hypothetical protein
MRPPIQIVAVSPGVKALRINGALHDDSAEEFIADLAEQLGLSLDGPAAAPRKRPAVPTTPEVQLYGTFADRPTVAGHEAITKAELLSGWCRLINQTKGLSVRAEAQDDNGWIAHCLPQDLTIVSGMLPYGGHGLEMQFAMSSENRIAAGGQSPPPPPAAAPPVVVEQPEDERAAAVARMAAFDSAPAEKGLSFAEARAAAKPPTLPAVTQEEKDQLLEEARANQIDLTRRIIADMTDEQRAEFASSIGLSVPATSPPTSRSPGAVDAASALPEAAGELPSPPGTEPAAVDHTRSTLPEDPRRVTEAFTPPNH